jgi:hypothetical protein
MAAVELADELARAAAAAGGFAAAGEELAGVLAAEPVGGARRYVCAFAAGDDRSWLVVDDDGEPVTRRESVRETASIVALCELAEETAGGGQLEELRQQLVRLRLTESPEGIEAAEAAALALERVLGAPPRIASPAFLDAVGRATRELEQALGAPGGSAFAEAMKASVATVDAFATEVLDRYKLPLA